MYINEVSRATSLTKKAIEYYVKLGLISPCILENGYRDFSESDICSLKKTSVLRKLGISTEDIQMVLADETGGTLQRLSAQKELDMQRQKAKMAVLDKLSGGNNYESITAELKTIEQNATITEKLFEAFPGYYGRFVCLHFARFLNEPITTIEQQTAYEKIVVFLDSVPHLDLPKDLQDYLIEGTKHIGTQSLNEMIASTKHAIENPEDFLLKNKEMLDQYFAYKQSEDYKNSPAFKIQSLLKEFNRTSGYYDVFIPMMKQLSSAYANYSSQMEIANEKLLAQYPELAK